MPGGDVRVALGLLGHVKRSRIRLDAAKFYGEQFD